MSYNETKNNIYKLKKTDVDDLKHKKQTMALLTKLLKDKGMTQAELAKELKRDKTTVNRWCKDTRHIAWDNAVEISKALNCHPVEIYEPSIKLPVKYYINGKWQVKKFENNERIFVSVPFEYSQSDVFCVIFDIPGSHLDGEVCIFACLKAKKFSNTAISKFCFCTPSKSWLKKHPNAPLLAGVLETNYDGTFKIIDPFTKKPITVYAETINREDLDLVSPIISKFNPTLKADLFSTTVIKK
jgi:transcriptional regulator with XRE-family HTH domain